MIRKGHTIFLIFHFWDLKLVPIDSALNSASGKFLKNAGVASKKPAKFENPG